MWDEFEEVPGCVAVEQRIGGRLYRPREFPGLSGVPDRVHPTRWPDVRVFVNFAGEITRAVGPDGQVWIASGRQS